MTGCPCSLSPREAHTGGGEVYMAAIQQVTNLIALLDEKLKLLERMLKYTMDQSQAITENDTDKLSIIVGKKERLIEKINEIDKKFEEEFLSLKLELGVESLDELNAGGVEGAEELIAGTRKVVAMIERIKVTEDENRNKAKRLLNVLEEKIKKMNQGKKMRSAYGNTSSEVPPYFMDKKK
jgi:hypothetical protein